MTAYIPSLADIVASMEEFAKEAGKGAIAMEQSETLRIDGIAVEITNDRMLDEATYQAAQTPITLFQDVYEKGQDLHADLEDIYDEAVVNRALVIG